MMPSLRIKGETEFLIATKQSGWPFIRQSCVERFLEEVDQ